MSLTPVTPDFEKAKEFWFKKDSIGAWLLIGGIAVVAFWGWGVISAFVVMALTNTLQTIWLLAAVLLSLAVLTSKRFHILLRLISRWLTNLFIPIFPLEILEDRVSQAKKRNSTVKEMITKVSGKVRLLKDTITKNHQIAQKKFEEAAYAKGRVGSLTDKNEALRYALAVQVRTSKGDRLEKANLSYQDILDRIQKIYDFLVKASIYLDAFIEDAEDEVTQETIKHQTISDAWNAFRAAMKILKGDTTEEELYGSAKQFLDNDYSQKTGEIEDMMRVATTFIDNMDIENGVVSESAMEQLDKYEQKLLTAGNAQTVDIPAKPQMSEIRTPVKGKYDLFK